MAAPGSGFFPHLSPSTSGIKRPHPALPRWEFLIYLFSGLGSILYATYHLFEASRYYLFVLNEDDFVDGWSFLNRKKDISNYEWHFWSTYFWQILPFGLGHIVIARIVEVVLLPYRRQILLMYSMMSVTYLLSYRTVLYFLVHCGICFISSSLGSFAFVWLVSLLLLLTLNFDYFNELMMDLSGLSKDENVFYLFIFVLAFFLLRYTSFCLERSRYIRELSKPGGKPVDGYSALDLLVYVFYFPTFFTGPLITYDKFRVQILSTPAPWTSERIVTAIKGFMRVFFWAAFIEFSHHYLYYNALPRNVTALEQMSLWAMVGIGYFEGQYFMIKYLVLYDLPSQVARLDDLDPPLGPKCISYIYRYSDMWKYFDRGLYMFLRNYIYIPLGGSHVGLPQRLFSSLLCFLYIYEWHGQQYYLLLWSLINFFGCSLELIGGELEGTQVVSNIKNTYLSPEMVRRIRCMLVVPLFLMSCFAIFYFFGGTYVGDLFIQRLLLQADMKQLVLFFYVIYANLQNAMEVERWLTLRYAGKEVAPNNKQKRN